MEAKTLAHAARNNDQTTVDEFCEICKSKGRSIFLAASYIKHGYLHDSKAATAFFENAVEAWAAQNNYSL